MFFSQLVPNGLFIASGYLLRRVVPVSLLSCVSIQGTRPLGVSKGTIVKSVLFGVPGRNAALVVGLCVSIFMMLTTPSSAEDRTISMFNIHTQETISITYKRDGRFIPEALQQLNHFMRDWRANLEHKIDPNLIDILWELHEQLGSKEPIHLVCGYRSPQTNEMLRHTVGGQAKNSRHLVGEAADIILPDVPLKQVRYAALALERGGVGYYPTSGLPFVHVDTGNVRHWGPPLSRMELALIFPNGHSRHVPSDGRPLTPADSRIALAKWQAAGNELPWIVSHRKASGTMLASLTPDKPVAGKPLLQQASLTLPEEEPAAEAPVKARRAISAPRVIQALKAPEAMPVALPKAVDMTPSRVRELIWEADDEPEDDAEEDMIPTDVLFAETPVAYMQKPIVAPHAAVFQKIGLLMSPPTAFASEELDQGLQIGNLYGANSFQGTAIAFIRQRRMTLEASAASRTITITTR